ncbi:MAG: metalloregulator ArsR/SmtB family transcription factor [Eggerthellaceae bacterium]|jgi:ArsR family transcriptional regulator
MPRDHEQDAKVFKALCNPYRLQALELLQSGEKCACDLNEAIDLSPSTLSHHMRILVESGIVTARQDGKWVHYSISKEGSRNAMELLADLTRVTPDPSFISACDR